MINKVLNEPVYDDDAVNKKYVDEQIEKVKENSVTKEDSEIKEDNVYSTEETIVGKWIDGKPIYRRVYNISLTFNGDTWKDSGITNTTIDVITYSCCFGYDIAYPNQLTKFGATMVSKNTNNKLTAYKGAAFELDCFSWNEIPDQAKL